MVCNRRCPTCRVLFPTVNALHDHGKLTSHPQRPYNCEPCKRAFKTLSDLQSHLTSNRHRHPESKGKTPAKAVVAHTDGGSWNAKKDDKDSVIEADSNYGNVHEEWLAEHDANGWGSLGNAISESSAQSDDRGPMLVEIKECPSTSPNTISEPLPSVSELTPPSTSSSSKNMNASAGPSPSKSDEATARARAALQGRFQLLGVSELDEAIDLLKSDICRTGKPEPSAPKLAEGSCSIATKSSSNSTNESKLPLNTLFTTTYPFTCPGCRKDFKLFSGFVLHIENRSCQSSVCHEIEDRIYTCATQLFGTLHFLRP